MNAKATETAAADTTAPVQVAGPYTNRSNANRALKRLTKSNNRDLFVDDMGTGGEEFFVVERVIDGETEGPKPSVVAAAKARFEAEEAARKASANRPEGPATDEATPAPKTPKKATTASDEKAPTIPKGAVEVGKKVRCGAGSVTYTHKMLDGKKFVYGRWTGEPGSPIVVFAAGRGWWKDGVHLEGVSTLAAAFEAEPVKG